jgi:hypothetical protein
MATQNESSALKEPPRLFAQVLDQLEDGELHRELSQKLQEMNNELGSHAAQNGAAKGELILKLKFAHDRNGVVEVTSDLAIKMPKTARARSVAWLAPSGNLLPENPKQTKLPLRSVGEGTERAACRPRPAGRHEADLAPGPISSSFPPSSTERKSQMALPNDSPHLKINAEPEAAAVARVVKDYFIPQVVEPHARQRDNSAAVLVVPKEMTLHSVKAICSTSTCPRPSGGRAPRTSSRWRASSTT